MFVIAILGAGLLLVGFGLGLLFQHSRGRVNILIQEANLKSKELSELQAFNSKLEANARVMKAKEIELVQANKRLESLEQAKSKFITVTTHQLRTPLSAIKWTFDMLMNGHLGVVSPEQKEFVTKAYASTERVIKIVNELLNLDHIEAEQSVYNFAPLSLPELVQTVVFEFSNQAASRQIRLDYQPPTGNLPLLVGDQSKLHMVVENLIDNAIKYSHSGGSVKIRILDQGLNSAKPAIELTVADRGIGISSADQTKIFQKFFRAANAVGAVPDGSGLGLYIGRDIVAKHGGSLWFESGPEAGTVFHLSLPLQPPPVVK